jgi:hypothetical protein
MAIYLQGVGATACKFTVGGTDLTSRLKGIEITQEFDSVDVTASNATSKAYLVGLAEDTWTISLYQDFASNMTDSVFYPLLGSSTGATFVYQTNGGTVTATNPKYTLVGTVYSYQPVSGSVGDVSELTVEVKPAAGSTTVRGTS